MKYSKQDRSVMLNVLDEFSLGSSESSLSKKYNIPRGTIQYWVKKGIPKEYEGGIEYIESNIKNNPKLYSYILGLYLGDGYLDKIKDKNLYKIRITQDKKYPKLLELIRSSIQEFFKGTCFLANCQGCYQITLYKKDLNLYFPQHSKGYKHLREIKLTEFQKENVDNIELLRGLFHSDGSFYIRKSNNKIYYNYNFTNKSKDIIDIFTNCLDSIGISYGTRIKKNEIWVVQIQKTSEVKKLHSILGDKINPFLNK